MMLERRFVELREVPQRDGHREQHTGGERARGPAREAVHPVWPEERPDHPRRRAVQEQRRKHQRQQQMLHHVGAEQVAIGEVVERTVRSEEHTSELQSLAYLVCRLLLEKKKKKKKIIRTSNRHIQKKQDNKND